MSASGGANQVAVASASSPTHLTPLLSTKLFTPRFRPGLVTRPRLLARLEAGLRGPLTVLAAPAGSGKTSLLGEWRAADASVHPVAWVSLDAGDNDPVRFWTYVLTALNTVAAGVGDDAFTLLRARQTPQFEAVLTTLLNALAAAQEDVVLVLDDYHLIEAEVVHATMAFLLDHQPPRIHLVISTREDPPLPLARLRAQRAITELRAADLRFTLEETTAFLATALGLALPADAVAVLEARSEGWIAGLQLAALSVQGRPPSEIAAFITAFSGSNRYIVDYLVEEVLARQTPAMQDFLERTAVLNRICAPLCERLLSNDLLPAEDARGRLLARHWQPEPLPVPRRPPAQTLLEQVERANLFLYPLDDERHWYRYHHLFADVLRIRLRLRDPELYAELHRRASVWFEEQGLTEEAVDYALAAADFARAAELIERHGAAVGATGQAETLLGWLKALPPALMRTRPLLCATHAIILYSIGASAEAVQARLLEADAAVEGCRQGGATDEDLQVVLGVLTFARALVATMLGDYAASMPLIQEALNRLPQSAIVWRAGAQALLCQLYELTGTVTAADARTLAKHIAEVREAGSLQLALVGLMDLGHMERFQGKLRVAAATYQELIHAIPAPLQLEDLDAGPGCAFGLGEVQLEWGDLDEAERLLVRGMRMLGERDATARTVALGYLTLARLRQARGDPTGALAALDTFAELAVRRHFAAAWAERGAAMRAQLQLVQGDLAPAVRWAEGCRLSADDVGLPFLLEPAYLALVRVRIAQGLTAADGLALSDAERLLERLLADAEAKGRGHSVLELLLLRALAHQARRDVRGALRTLLHALTLAAPEGFVRLFADEGTPMAALLTELIEAAERRRLAVPPSLLDYAGFLLNVCRVQDGGSGVFHVPPLDTTITAAPHAGTPPLLDPLTEREVEVLRLLAEGASNADIADTLVVSVGTVKKHVFNVCRKLDVRNRTQAVARARARALHLL